MPDGNRRATDAPRLIQLVVGDDPEAWARAGFRVVDGVARIGQVRIALIGSSADGASGIVRWAIAGLHLAGDDLDGLPTGASEVIVEDGGAEPPHPNGVIGLDHVVVLTPDLERTIATIEATGLDLRRIREATSEGVPVRQAFFKLGPVVLEVVSGDGTGGPSKEAPARFFGLAMDVEDLDATGSLLGEHLGRVKPAVQQGRRIATVRHRSLGISVPIALMDRHGDRTTGDGGR